MMPVCKSDCLRAARVVSGKRGLFAPLADKEDLEEVLAPTIESVSAAIRTYELQGGTANVSLRPPMFFGEHHSLIRIFQLLVSEDGLQLFDEKEVLKRRDYYERWNCKSLFVAPL